MKFKKIHIIFIILSCILLHACNAGHSGQNGLNTETLCYFPIIFTEVIEEADGMNEYTYTKFVNIENGKELFTSNGAARTLFREGFAIMEYEDGLYFVNKKGEKKLGPYADATEFNDNIALVAEHGGIIKAINTKGKIVFTLPHAENAVCFNEGMALYEDENGVLGMVDAQGKTTKLPITTIEDVIPWFVNGILVVKTQGDAGATVTRLIDKKGNYKDLPYGINVKFTEDEFYYAGLFAPIRSKRLIASKNRKYGVITLNGEWLINPQYDDIWVDGDLYLFKKGRLYGWCDKDGKYVISPNYSEVCLFGDNNITVVKDRELYKYINKKGETVMDGLQYYTHLPFTKSNIAFIQDRSYDYGAIDKNGRYVINPQYRNVVYLTDNRFLVNDDSGDYGIIDEKGRYIMNLQPCKVNSGILHTYNSGLPRMRYVKNQFVDYESISEALQEASDSIQPITAGQLKESGVHENRFSKNGGYITVKELHGKLYDISVKTYFDAWIRTSDGWFGYKYIFNPNAKSGRYVISLELKDKAKGKSDAMFHSFVSPIMISNDNKSISIKDKVFSIEKIDYTGNKYNFRN